MSGFLILVLATAAAAGGSGTAVPLAARALPVRHVSDVGPIKRSAIVVAIELRAVTEGTQRRILANFKFTNRAGRPKNLERWLVLKPPTLEMNLLSVRAADGTSIPYVGPQIKRRILPTDYVPLLPGETRVAKDIDVTAGYRWPEGAGDLSVQYRAISVFGNQMEVLESESVSLHLQ